MSSGNRMSKSCGYLFYCLLYATIGFAPSLSRGQTPTPVVTSILNATHYGSKVASGDIAVVIGTNLARSVETAGPGVLPTTLGGASLSIEWVSFAGALPRTMPVPLFFASPTQLNIQIPWELQFYDPPIRATLSVTVGGQKSAAVTVNLSNFALGIFSLDQSGRGQGAVLIAGPKGRIAAPAGAFPNSRPARPTEFIAIYCVGIGPAWANAVGRRPPSGTPTPASPLHTVFPRQFAGEEWPTPRVTVGGVPAAVSFAGLAPGFVGLSQINAQIPPNAPAGNAVPVQIKAVDGTVSNTVTIAVQTPGTISTVAGVVNLGDGGLAVGASLKSPHGVAIDGSGNIYIADAGNYRVRKIDTNGTITTLAGTTNPGFSGDGGPAANASLSSAWEVAADQVGNVYISDFGRVRVVDTKGVITTIAGGSSSEFSGDGGLAVKAGLSPNSVAVDSVGNLYIVDNRARVRRVDPGGIITTVAGNGVRGYGGDGGRAVDAELVADKVAVDRLGNLYISGECEVRRVTPEARIERVAGGVRMISAPPPLGGIVCMSDGDGGLASRASLTRVSGLATDDSGNLYIADGALLRRVDQTGFISTVASVRADGIAVDAAGNIYVSDMDNHVIRRIETNGVVSTIAGATGVGDGGPADRAFFVLYGYTSLAFDSFGDLYISEDCRIRRIDPSGIITTFAGNDRCEGLSPDGQSATSVKVSTPAGLSFDRDGNLYFAANGSHRVRKVDTNGILTTVAGNGSEGFSGDGGLAALASLNAPRGVVVDQQGNIYIADTNNNRVRRVDTSGVITTVLELSQPLGLAVDSSGTLYIAQLRVVHRLESNGLLRVVAGPGISGYSGDGGLATNASFRSDGGSIALDSSGNLFIADTYNHRVRRVDEDGLITTVVGDGTRGFKGDGGPATLASLAEPIAIAVDAQGDLYIADRRNLCVRRVRWSP